MPPYGSGAAVTRRQALAAGAAFAATGLIGACKRSDEPAPRSTAELPVAGGPPRPPHYRFQLGDFEITTLSDAGAVIDGPWPIVGEDRPPAEVGRLMHDSLLPEKRFRPGFTPMLVKTPKELILFDTGNGANGFVPRPYGG